MSLTSGGNSVAGGSTLNLASGATLNLQDSNTNTLNFTSGGTLGGGRSSSTWHVGRRRSNLRRGRHPVGVNAISLSALGTTLNTGTSAYTLITGASGLSSSYFSVPSTIVVNGRTYNLSLSSNAGDLYLGVSTNYLPTINISTAALTRALANSSVAINGPLRQCRHH